jgi:hypothetical protein
MYNQYVISVFKNNGIIVKLNNDNSLDIDTIWLDEIPVN